MIKTNRRAAARATAALTSLALIMLTGCSSLEGMRFVADQRVEFATPDYGETVSLPLTFSWTTELPEDQIYALFIGTDAVGAGQSVYEGIPADNACKATGDCYTDEALLQSNIYIVSGTSITVTSLPARAAGDPGIEAQLVLLNDDLTRDGESLWYVTFWPPEGD